MNNNSLSSNDFKSKLYNFAEELVCNHAKYIDDEYRLNLSDLSEANKATLVRYYIEYTDRDTSECLYGDNFSKYSPFKCALIAMLQNDCQQTREVFARLTLLNIFEYYKTELQSILDEACINYLNNLMNEVGYAWNQDLHIGESYWMSNHD